MMFSKSTLTFCLALLLLGAGPAFAKKNQPLPQITEDGLHLVPDTKLAVVYAEPGADLVPYKRVKLLDAYVSFKKNWARNQSSGSGLPGRVSNKDMERIKTTMAEEFHKVFTKVLEDGGYPVVDEVGEDVLIVRPAIVDLNPNAPDIASSGMSRTYTDSAGDMTLYIELYDSQTGDLMAKAMDKRIDGRHDGFYTWANRATNRAAADRILKGWATILLEALNEAKK